jgi:exosome complex component RRP41
MKVTITFEADVAELDMSAMQPFVDAIADGEAAASESVYESESESELIIFADEAEEAEEEAEEEYEDEEAEDEEAEDEEAEDEEAEDEEAEEEAEDEEAEETDEQTDQ